MFYCVFLCRDINEVVASKVPRYYQSIVVSQLITQIAVEVQRISELPGRPKRRDAAVIDVTSLPPSVYSFLPSTQPAPATFTADSFVDDVLLSVGDPSAKEAAPAPSADVSGVSHGVPNSVPKSTPKTVARSASAKRRTLARDVPPNVSTLAFYRTSAAPSAARRDVKVVESPREESLAQTLRSRLTPLVRSTSVLQRGTKATAASTKTPLRR